MQYIKEIAVFLILVNLLSMLTGNNEYKKYLSIFSGIILILIIIKPLKVYLSDTDFEASINKKLTEYDIVEINQSLDEVNEEIGRSTKRIYEEKLSENMMRFLAQNDISAEKVEVELEIADNSLVYSRVDIDLDEWNMSRYSEELSNDYEVNISGTGHISEVKIDYVNHLVSEEYGIEKEIIHIK